MNTEPEIMERVDELLRIGNRRRALGKAVQYLSGQQKQRFWSVLSIFFVLLPLVWIAFQSGSMAQIGGRTVFFILSIALLNFCVGLIIMQAYSKSRDKLLLMLAEEVLRKNDEPGKPAEK